nr:transposase [Megasphaera elsdenii]
MRTERGIRQVAVYVMLAYDTNEYKDVLGLWINETESKHVWMQIFDELKARGIEDLGILSIDGVSGLEEGAKAIFPNVTVQRCIVHLVRNSIRYIPRKQWSAFTKQLKGIYGAVSVEEARRGFDQFKQDWQGYPGAGAVWENNVQHVEQLFNYGSAVRKAMYTTNTIESVNASFRKVTKKGSFPNEDAVFKIFYLRILELYKKWNSHRLSNWAMIRNQLLIDERLGPLMEKYDKDF